jgi:cellulose biosynthesis protein BcsQ
MRMGAGNVMGRREAVGNDKGGPGKTTISTGLAGSLARAGHRVLVVDMDPQANATRRLRAVMDATTPTINDALVDGTPGCAADAIADCGWDVPYAPRIGIVPSGTDLTNRDSDDRTGWWRALARVLDGADDRYDFTILDCKPGFGHLTQMVLAAADGVLCVVNPAFDAVEAATRLRDFTAGYAAVLGNPGLRVTGYAGCQVDLRLTEHRWWLENMPASLGEPVWEPAIPLRTVIHEANNAGQPLDAYGQDGRKVIALFDELAARYLRAVR